MEGAEIMVLAIVGPILLCEWKLSISLQALLSMVRWIPGLSMPINSSQYISMSINADQCLIKEH